MPQADWRSAVPVDMAPGTVTAPVLVITSGAEAIRAARDLKTKLTRAGAGLLSGANHGPL